MKYCDECNEKFTSSQSHDVHDMRVLESHVCAANHLLLLSTQVKICLSARLLFSCRSAQTASGLMSARHPPGRLIFLCGKSRQLLPDHKNASFRSVSSTTTAGSQDLEQMEGLGHRRLTLVLNRPVSFSTAPSRSPDFCDSGALT
jgi:hypothetical protein